MKKLNIITWVEIPVLDMILVKMFDETVFHIPLNLIKPGEVLELALFPVKEKGIGVALCKHEKFSSWGIMVH